MAFTTSEILSQFMRIAGHRFWDLIGSCLTSEWSILSTGWQGGVCFGVEEGQWKEMAVNKGWGLKVCSFWTIPGTRILLPRDPGTTQPLRHLWLGHFKGLRAGCLKQQPLPSSSSAVQTHLKNNTFPPLFICCLGLCSYLWVVFVADRNLLPLIHHSLDSRGIMDGHGTRWTL